MEAAHACKGDQNKPASLHRRTLATTSNGAGDKLWMFVDRIRRRARDEQQALVATIFARRSNIAGLLTGGALDEDRTLAVQVASVAEADIGLIANRAVVRSSLVTFCP